MDSALSKIFSLFPAVKLAYLFGSRAKGTADARSDYDYAVYLDEPDSGKRFDTRLSLMTALSRHHQTDKVDVVVLNDTDNPVLDYHAINGKLVYQKGPFRAQVEPTILGIYRDYHITNNLFRGHKA